MIRKIAAYTTLLSLVALSAPDAYANGALQSQARPGDYTHTNNKTTSNYHLSNSLKSAAQRLSTGYVRPTGLGGLATIHGPTGRNGLPNTSLDSFVLNAGGSANQIYGDEGANGLPPFFEFTKAHRINTGIQGPRDEGITTGHGSYLPDAWGGDEFVDGPEFSQAGKNGGQPNHWSQGTFMGSNPGTPNQTNPGVNPLNNMPNPNSEGPQYNNVYFPEGSLGSYTSQMGNGGENPNGWSTQEPPPPGGAPGGEGSDDEGP